MTTATMPFFSPMDELPEHHWAVARSHYGESVSNHRIAENVYGGFPLNTLFASITIEASDEQVDDLRADIRLNPVPGSNLEVLELLNVSLRQVLVAALPHGNLPGWDPSNGWDGANHWQDVDTQYRLELCQSEISRWSLVFKKDGAALGGAEIVGDDAFSHIELVNNCTTTRGFELKIRRGQRLFHGSFGRERAGQADVWLDLYTRLSQRQAGSLALQNDPLDDRAETPMSFFDIYGQTARNRWADKEKHPIDASPTIELSRYRRLGDREKTGSVELDTGRIVYERWGRHREYYQKPIERRLTGLWRFPGRPATPDPPLTYADIFEAAFIELPNFKPEGIYALHDPQRKTKYGWLKQLERFDWHRQEGDRHQLTLWRKGGSKASELRRIVFGNLDEKLFPVAPKTFELHRFGYGARPTTMAYDPAWRPSMDPEEPAHFAYLLGGKNPGSRHAIQAEAFGLERVLFSWADRSKKQLVVDLIGFERLLPVWRGLLDLS